MKDYIPAKVGLVGTQKHVSRICESSAVKRNQPILLPSQKSLLPIYIKCKI